MLVTNKTVFGRTKKFSEKNLKSLKNFRRKKSSAEQKNFSGEDFFCSQNIHEYSEKWNFRNENSEILFVTKTIECQFYETRTFVFPKAIVCGPWSKNLANLRLCMDHRPFLKAFSCKEPTPFVMDFKSNHFRLIFSTENGLSSVSNLIQTWWNLFGIHSRTFSEDFGSYNFVSNAKCWTSEYKDFSVVTVFFQQNVNLKDLICSFLILRKKNYSTV